MMILAIKILKYVTEVQADDVDVEGVSLAFMRRHYNIPTSTFYRHVSELIDERLIVRIARDRYILYPTFTELIGIAETREYNFNSVLRDFQLTLPL